METNYRYREGGVMCSRQIDKKGDGMPDAPRFPSARYFQVHFEHLYELIGELKAQLHETKLQIAILQQNQGQSSRDPASVHQPAAGEPCSPTKPPPDDSSSPKTAEPFRQPTLATLIEMETMQASSE